MTLPRAATPGTIWAALVDLLFPPACVGCRRAGQPLCDRCAQAVPPLLEPLCPRCGQPLDSPGLCALCRSGAPSSLTMARAAALYEEPLRAAIHALKYEGRTELATPLARYLVAALQRPEWVTILPGLDAVVPVPLHAQRLAARGYNQSALIAAALCERLALPHHPEWLERRRDTRPQVGLTAAQRRGNVADSFCATRRLTGQTLLIVDDVYTTGATLRACAQAALDGGAGAVYALTLARPLLIAHDQPLP